MCYTFAKAQGHTVGSSLVEEDKVDLAKSFIEKGGDKLILPIDSVVSSKFGEDGDIKVVGEDVPEGYMGLDIGPKTVELFAKNLKVLRQLSGMALWVYSKCLSSQKVLKLYVAC